MQHRYVADVGDFGKYGLLRALSAQSSEKVRLGVVWHLVLEEELDKRDGRHTGYLRNRSNYESCNPDLYARLQKILDGGTRSLTAIEQSHVLPESTIFFNEPLSFHGLPKDRRLAERDSWLERAVSTMTECNLVFLDPDNGLASSQERLIDLNGPKFACISDIQRYLQRNQSVVLYHHLNRLSKHQDQVRQMIRFLSDQLQVNCFGFWLRRGTGRLFAVIPSAEHLDSIRSKAKRFAASPWVTNRHFYPVEIC